MNAPNLASAARPATTRASTRFESLDGARSSIVVSLVLVPPNGAGAAWGHTERGECVEFTQSREAMLPLFHQVRAAGRITPVASVIVDAREWQVRRIERGECPIHALPPIEEGTAIAFAPY